VDFKNKVLLDISRDKIRMTCKKLAEKNEKLISTR